MNTFTHGTRTLIKHDIELINSSDYPLVACSIIADTDTDAPAHNVIQLFYREGNTLIETDSFTFDDFRIMIQEGHQTPNGLRINW